MFLVCIWQGFGGTLFALQGAAAPSPNPLQLFQVNQSNKITTKLKHSRTKATPKQFGVEGDLSPSLKTCAAPSSEAPGDYTAGNRPKTPSGAT